MTVHIFDDKDLEAVKRVFDSGQLCSINGQVSRQFEDAFKEMMGVAGAVTVNSGMSALHCAVSAAGASAGDEVICDSIVQFGSMAVVYNNAMPVFADMRRDTMSIDPESVRERITERTKAIICTHMWGLPADVDPLMEIAEEFGLVVIEDCAQAILGEYKGRLTGTLGHMAEFSFQMGKHLALGDGGMATTTEERFIEGLVDASGVRGISTFPKLMWNYRMNEVIAAIGLVQLDRLKSYVKSARAKAQLYDEAFEDVEWLVAQRVPPDRKHAHSFWAGLFEGDKYGISMDRFKEAVERNGARLNIGYIQKAPYLYDVYTEPLMYGRDCPLSCPFQLRRMEYTEGLCPVSEELMPRIVRTGTRGPMEHHYENVEKLRDVIEEFK